MSAEAITIPSPSVFLRKSPTPPSPTRPPSSHASSSSATKNARRLDTVDTQNKAPRKAGGPAGNADGGVAKPKQSKSRNGCVTCKAKRLKCGEEKPECQQCSRRHVKCGGYKKDFKWRPFEEASVKTTIDRQKRASSPKQVSPESSKGTTPITDATPVSDVDKTREGEAVRKQDGVVDKDAGKAVQKGKCKQKQPQDEREPITPTEELVDPGPPTLISDRTSPPVNVGSGRMSPEIFQPGSLSHLTPGLGLSPTLTNMLLPFDEHNPAHQDFVSFELPEGFQPLHLHDSLIDPDLIDEHHMVDDNVQIVGVDGPTHELPLILHNSHNRPTTPKSPNPARNAFHPPMTYIFPQPFFPPDSTESLTRRFDKLTCGVLSILDGPTENPWRSLIWPLAQQSPALYHAMTAMTAFHAATDHPRLRLVGQEHKQASIRYIQEGIRDQSMTDQTAIATALALGFSESWDQHTATGNTHIKGAQALVKRALDEHRRNPLSGVELARLKFLSNAWVYMDVIARLTSVDSDESNDFDNAFLFSSDNLVSGSDDHDDHDDHRGFGIDFGMPIDARLDPLMGCANTLFPLIGRVANLVRKVCRSQTNSPAVISQANDLKLALEAWDPPEFIERPEDPSTDVQHTLQTAEAYRWATLLHLHQSVPELPSLTSAELARRVLNFLATVPLASRTVIVQIYPLMVAGCEAATEEDRDWVRGRWASMGHRMRLGIIEKSATVTEEVWRRRDVYEAQPPTNRKIVATADLHPVRQQGVPLVRTDTGYRGGDPGRTGMVFSYVETEHDARATGPIDKNRVDRNNARDRMRGKIDTAYTVRGHLHWVGVMWDWGWEILLG